MNADTIATCIEALEFHKRRETEHKDWNSMRGSATVQLIEERIARINAALADLAQPQPPQVNEHGLLPCGESWRPIPGYEGYYDASDLGRIRSWYTGGGYRLLQPHIKKTQRDKNGYPFVLLYKEKECRGFRVARLVLYAFSGIPTSDMEASHLDGSKENNSLANLCWETKLENEQRKEAHGTRPRGEGNAASKITEVEVREIIRLRASGEKLSSLSAMFGISESNVSAICNRRIWKHVE